MLSGLLVLLESEVAGWELWVLAFLGPGPATRQSGKVVPDAFSACAHAGTADRRDGLSGQDRTGWEISVDHTTRIGQDERASTTESWPLGSVK